MMTCCIAAIVGCGGAGHPPVAPATGIVTVDGKPLSQGRVTTEPIASSAKEKPGKAGFGIIQPDGTFVLSTYGEDDGAIVGPHRITLYGDPPYSLETEEESASPRKKPRPPFGVFRVIGQKFEVLPEQNNHFKIELTSQMVRKFGERDN